MEREELLAKEKNFDEKTPAEEIAAVYARLQLI